MIREVGERLIYWLYRRLMRRKNLAPPLEEGRVCEVPGCAEPASEQWMPSCCALREGGVPVDWVAVCAAHDVEFNEVAVRQLYGDRFEDELAAYRESRLGQ